MSSSGFVLLDKIAGETSFKALFPLKRVFCTKRVGHAGTLDLRASGLIIAATGRATRLLPYIEAKDKCYTFRLHLGYETDTLEWDGEVVRQDDKCVGRESQPCLHGYDRAQHLGLEQSESPKTRDESDCHPGAEGDRIQESDNVAMSVRQALLTCQSAAEMLECVEKLKDGIAREMVFEPERLVNLNGAKETELKFGDQFKGR